MKTSHRFPKFPTAGALASALGVQPKHVLAHKAAGTAGFHHSSRIDSGALLADLINRAPPTLITLRGNEALGRLVAQVAGDTMSQSWAAAESLLRKTAGGAGLTTAQTEALAVKWFALLVIAAGGALRAYPDPDVQMPTDLKVPVPEWIRKLAERQGFEPLAVEVAQIPGDRGTVNTD